MLSIRSKIVLTLVTALMLSGLVSSLATFYAGRNEFSRLFDTQLQHVATELSMTRADALSRIAFLGLNPEEKVLVQIYDSSNNRTLLSRQGITLPIAEKTGFSTITGRDGQVWRQYVSTSESRIIQVAQPASVRTSMAISAALHMVQPFFVLLPFLAIAIWFVTDIFLRALDRTAAAVAKRSPVSLEAIPTDSVPREIQGLVVSINSLMARLEANLVAQRRFTSEAAHELRTPLAGIKLQAQLVRKAKTDEDRERYLRNLMTGVSRASRMIEQLLTIARLEPEAIKQNTQPVRLDTLAQSVAEELALKAEEKSISIEVRAQVATVLGIGDTLRLLLTNLVGNALRYGRADGRIIIGVDTVDGFAILRVSDDGPGIPQEERSRIFERFYRVLGTKVSGTGLGLAIVKRITELHQGFVDVTDGLAHRDGSGVGIEFRVRLPLSSSD